MRHSRHRPLAEINLVPFIDVCLVLLVVFMITTPLLTQGVKVTLPQTAAKPLPSPQTPLVVTVDAGGRFYLNLSARPGQPVTPRVLAHLAGEALATQAAPPAAGRSVLVRGDHQVSYGKIVEAMVILQQAGARSVGLVTAPSRDQGG